MHLRLNGNIEISTKDLLLRLENEGIIDSEDIVFLGGSLIESSIRSIYKDMGNLESDIDVFIFKKNNDNLFIDEKGAYRKNDKITIFKRYDSIDYDIEIYNLQAIENLIKSIDDILVDESLRTRNSFSLPNSWNSREVNSIINRMNNSLAIQNESAFQSILDRIKWRNYGQYRKRLLINEIDNLLPDIWGNLSPRIFEVAVMLSRKLLTKFMEIILINEGETVDREKWVIYKSLILATKEDTKYKDLAACFNNIFLSDVSDFNKAKEIIIDTINYVNDSIIEMDE